MVEKKNLQQTDKPPLTYLQKRTKRERLRDGMGRFMRSRKRQLMPSQREMMKTLRYMGTDKARIDLPMLHPDHIKWSIIVLDELARDLSDVVAERATNVNKIFAARVAVQAAKTKLEHHNISRTAGEVTSAYYSRKK